MRRSLAVKCALSLGGQLGGRSERIFGNSQTSGHASFETPGIVLKPQIPNCTALRWCDSLFVPKGLTWLADLEGVN